MPKETLVCPRLHALPRKNFKELIFEAAVKSSKQQNLLSSKISHYTVVEIESGALIDQFKAPHLRMFMMTLKVLVIHCVPPIWSMVKESQALQMAYIQKLSVLIRENQASPYIDQTVCEALEKWVSG